MMMREIHDARVTIDDIVEVLKRTLIHPRIIEAIKSAYAAGCELRIVSNAKLFLIKTKLNHLGLRKYFTKINTNPGFVDEEGRLRILPFHDFSKSSHGCGNLCSPNMCKNLHTKSYPEANMEFLKLNEIKLFQFEIEGYKVLRLVDTVSSHQFQSFADNLYTKITAAMKLVEIYKPFLSLGMYRDFKKSLLQVHDGKADDAARQAMESLIKLMKNHSTPQRFWLPLLYDLDDAPPSATLQRLPCFKFHRLLMLEFQRLHCDRLLHAFIWFQCLQVHNPPSASSAQTVHHSIAANRLLHFMLQAASALCYFSSSSCYSPYAIAISATVVYYYYQK